MNNRKVKVHQGDGRFEHTKWMDLKAGGTILHCLISSIGLNTHCICLLMSLVFVVLFTCKFNAM
ncbi:hypothetical protein ES288_D11G152600v1 [Gossypium darwinii]|uniref:Uncharacterized protein n=2 Tax=Gossypium TaxID=3633 RepID=A0A5D2IP18_GOSTO|nr:hypothetical protein ES288_D11G152600v1 [Gossypium darwinii]TYH43779.1 hypothetical protein ES332_D11G150400v1 [Gossypium tomentosum]